MKLTRLLFGFLIAAILGSSIFLAFAAGNIDVQLQIPIGTREKITACNEVPDLATADPNDKKLVCTGLSDYIVTLYEWLVAAAAILAAAMLTWGGFQWLSAAGESKRVEEGKKIMHNALIGLVLALGSYTLLWAINPDLVGVGKLDLSLVAPKPILFAGSSTPITQQVVNGAVSPTIFKRAKINKLNECIDLINHKRSINTLVVNVPMFFCKGTFTSARLIDCWATQTNAGDNAIAASCTNKVDLSATPLNQSAPPDTAEGVCCYKDALPTP